MIWTADLIAAVLLVVFCFYVLYEPETTPSIGATMTAAWLAAHKKAIGAFLTVLVTQATALLSLGILSGPVAHNVALAITAASPILAFFGVKATAANS